MKLRNKKTGEIFDALVREKGGGGSYSLIVCDIKAYEQSKSTLDQTHFVLDEYETLAELNEEWEDYVPVEPLIKDEKIRKVVRAWAEINGIDKAQYVAHGSNEYTLFYDEKDVNLWIQFEKSIGELVEYQFYTITELCGEEEE